MDIVKHIIREQRLRKQMYDNHECTAIEVEGRSFNEKILALADHIEELEAQNKRLISRGFEDLHDENEQLRKWIIDNARHPQTCPKGIWEPDTAKRQKQKCTCGLQAILENDDGKEKA